jgi:polyphosphate kinase
LINILETCFADNVKARRLLPDGSYEPISRNGPKIRAQQKFYQESLAAVREASHAEPQFQPLTRPKE